MIYIFITLLLCGETNFLWRLKMCCLDMSSLLRYNENILIMQHVHPNTHTYFSHIFNQISEIKVTLGGVDSGL